MSHHGARICEPYNTFDDAVEIPETCYKKADKADAYKHGQTRKHIPQHAPPKRADQPLGVGFEIGAGAVCSFDVSHDDAHQRENTAGENANRK